MVYILRLTILLFIVGTIGAFYIGFLYPAHSIVFLCLVFGYAIIEHIIQNKNGGM